MERKDKYSISEIASMFDITSRTIRYYEQVGLLKSEEREGPTQQRYFTDSERRRLKLILRGKRQGFKLEEIKEMIDLYESNPTGEKEKQRILQYADEKIAEITEKIHELEVMRTEIETNRQRFLEENTNSPKG
ncbi:MerR family DNA-binding protein [Alkalihalobacterium elongatum]|uniref:MerR family DNA-binding protein n=1 Tax=Alkalihalobacterium elongatum TaxID=2675466 RepID=UPI001C1F790D|nr:MerR family DNA-binding protein [Alkalihalobacterium elongatum]